MTIEGALKNEWQYYIDEYYKNEYDDMGECMKIRGNRLIRKASMRHADLRESIDRWVELVEEAIWENPEDLKSLFPSADFVRTLGGYVFNIGGNKYRILSKIDFIDKSVEVIKIGTHDEYDRW